MASQSPAKRSVRLHLADLKPSRSRQKSRSVLSEDLSHISLPSESVLERKSRRRAEALAGSHLPETEAVRELRLQLVARDQYLEEVNEQLVQCTGLMKAQERDSVHRKERLITQLMKEKGELLLAVQTLQQETQRLINAQVLASEPSVSQRDQTLETFRLDIEALKGELAARDTVVESLKQDLTKMTEIVVDLTNFNAELNAKVANLNLEVEEKAKTCHEALAKAHYLEAAEKSLAELIADKQNLEDQVTKLTEKSEKLEELEQIAVQVSTNFDSLEARLPSEFAQQVGHLRELLAPFQAETVRQSSDTAILRNKVRQQEVELRAANRDQTRQSRNEAALQVRLSAQEAEQSTIQASLAHTIEGLTNTITTLQKGFDNFANRYDDLAKKLEKTCADAQVAQANVTLLQSSCATFQSAAQQAAKAEARAQLALKDAHLQISVMQIGKTTVDAALQLREARVKEGSARLKALSEEVWKRDSLLLKKTAEILSLQEQIKALQATLLQAQMRVKMDAFHSARNRTAESRSKLSQIAINTPSYALKMRLRAHHSKSMVFSNSPESTNLQQAFTALMSKAIDVLARCSEAGEVPERVEGTGEETVEQALSKIIRDLEELLVGVASELPTAWLPSSLKSILSPESDTFPTVSLISFIKSLPVRLSRLSSNSEHSVS